MRIENLVVNCTARYPRTCRRTPFEVVVYELNYSSEDKDLMDLLRTKAEELARQVNPGAANNSMHERSPERILADCIAGVVSEYFWKLYLNSEENVVSETEFDDASRQIDLKVISNNKKIEVRSSFPRNGIEFAICHPSYEFDVIGPYSNNYKPGEIQKDYYVRTLFHLYNPTDIISMISADSFKVYLTGGATWDMMIDNDYSKNKTHKKKKNALQNNITMRFFYAPDRIRTCGLWSRRTTTWQCNQTLKREFCWFCTFAAKTRKSPLLVVTTGFSGIL